jgi:hypothetical protein
LEVFFAVFFTAALWVIRDLSWKGKSFGAPYTSWLRAALVEHHGRDLHHAKRMLESAVAGARVHHLG